MIKLENVVMINGDGWAITRDGTIYRIDNPVSDSKPMEEKTKTRVEFATKEDANKMNYSILFIDRFGVVHTERHSAIDNRAKRTYGE